MLGTLFVVGTPIGNLSDCSARTLETLKRVSYILAEDTRVAKKLLTHFAISTPAKRLDMHSSAKTFSLTLADLQSGKDVALISDAGTPTIADPGAQCIAYVLQHEPTLVVSPIPGPSALTAALSVAGFPSSSFTFYGFAPAKKGRHNFFKRIANRAEVVVLFESVHRITKTLQELKEHIGDRPVIVARELTKQFETVYRGSIATILENGIVEKGEFVIVVSPKK